MRTILSGNDRKRHRSATTLIKQSLRDLRSQLAMLNQQVSAKVAMKGPDLDCFDVIGRHGPITPSELSRRTGIHPATLTGVLDRLERGHWISRLRDADAADRRTVRVHALTERNRELIGHYSPMSTAMDQVCADYTADQLELIGEFLRRATEAGATATDELFASRQPGPPQE
ncbi:MarR family transcriptional regulator [Aeromicrobium sp. CTD01-1L150]|uniref:MarR family transcriptional regulator n=1 Tax=Aeromicrobium sp. CTD01-1L150 TaxID=3341830 RepID=UPI0035C0420E